MNKNIAHVGQEYWSGTNVVREYFTSYLFRGVMTVQLAVSHAVSSGMYSMLCFQLVWLFADGCTKLFSESGK